MLPAPPEPSISANLAIRHGQVATGQVPVERDAALIVRIHHLKTRELRSEIEEAWSGSRHEQV
jgi:hypothetical protein